MKRQIKYDVGSKVTNNHGTKFTIVGREGGLRILNVDDTDYNFKIVTSRISGASYKTPYCRSVYGVGYLGEGGYKCRCADGKITSEYTAWANMLRRAYTDYNSDTEAETYTEVTVSDGWHNFQNFAEWFSHKIEKYKNNNILYQLDKDFLSGQERGKLYSEQMCCILPSIINASLIQKRLTNTVAHGIYMKNGKYVAAVMYKYKANHKAFTDLDEAISWYRETKKRAIVSLAEEYKEFLDTEIYDKLMNWNWR